MMDSSKTLKVCVKDTVFIGTPKQQPIQMEFHCPCEYSILFQSQRAFVTNQSNAPAVYTYTSVSIAAF